MRYVPVCVGCVPEHNALGDQKRTLDPYSEELEFRATCGRYWEYTPGALEEELCFKPTNHLSSPVC